MEVSSQLYAPAALAPAERATGTHFIGVCMGPRAGLDTVVKRKKSSSCRKSNPRYPTPIPVTVLTEMSRLIKCYNYMCRCSSVSIVIS
jgi:hypothetical protein